MRYLTVVIRPIELIHPVEATLADRVDLRPVGIHQTKILDDGTCVTLLEVTGDLGTLEDLLAGHPSVLEHSIAGDRTGFVYLQTEPDELTRSLIDLQESAAVIVQMPVEHTGDGGLRATLLGDDAAFQRAIEAFPPDLEVDVMSTGQYAPEMESLIATLTDRQREILATAIRAGYYADPRAASQREIAATLDIAPGTVSEHLRRIEAKVFSSAVADQLP